MNSVSISTRETSRSGKYRSATIGGGVWIAGVLLLHPTPFDVEWAYVLLMFAPLVLVPLGIDLAENSSDRLSRTSRFLQLPSAIALGFAYLLPKGMAATVLASPWLVFTSLVAVLGVRRIRRNHRGLPHDVCIAAGFIYLWIGSGWATLDRLGVRPLDFDDVIVLLTAIHFHYAGFVLPVVTGLVAQHLNNSVSRVTARGVIVGVPLVATGITATQLGFSPVCEFLAAWFLAACGIVVGLLHFALARQRRWRPRVRICWQIAGASLIASMMLAAIYGTRFFAPVEWLDIPWMRALHGTANAFGFGFFGLVGWLAALPHARA